MKKAMPAARRGFTLLELILSITIMAILFSSVGLVFANLVSGQGLKSKGNELVETLREARGNAVTGKNDSAWGVSIDAASSPKSFTLFRGDSYATRDASFDFITNLPASVSRVSADLAGGGNEIGFSRTSGVTADTGTVTLGIEGQTFTVTVNRLGLVDYELSTLNQ